MPKVIDLFCGCGGLSEGFKLAGYTIIGGVDFNAPAIKTYNRNFPGAKGMHFMQYGRMCVLKYLIIN